MRAALIALTLAATSVRAEPFEDRGYALGCDPKACTIFAAGYLLRVANDGATPARLIRKLARMAPVTAVQVRGDLGALGDATASLTLTGVQERADDPYQPTLRALQGRWQAETTGLRIDGLEWQDLSSDAVVTRRFLVTPGATCADGRAPGGMTLSLYELGGAPSEGACWQVGSVTETALTLQDAKGDQGQLVFQRAPE